MRQANEEEDQKKQNSLATMETANQKQQAKISSRTQSRNFKSSSKNFDSPQDKTEQVKMIQRLTAFLPQNLAVKARDQIRQMTNSDAIYEQKEKLTNENRARAFSNHTKDLRWKRLEGSLCSTHGISNPWQRVNQRWEKMDSGFIF